MKPDNIDQQLSCDLETAAALLRRLSLDLYRIAKHQFDIGDETEARDILQVWLNAHEVDARLDTYADQMKTERVTSRIIPR